MERFPPLQPMAERWLAVKCGNRVHTGRNIVYKDACTREFFVRGLVAPLLMT